jgi:hypothetical protein
MFIKVKYTRGTFRTWEMVMCSHDLATIVVRREGGREGESFYNIVTLSFFVIYDLTIVLTVVSS